MAVISNTITTGQVEKALDVEFAANFNQEYDRLADVLGIVTPEVVAAGTALYQYVVTGSLSSATVAEGDEVPLSQYEVEKTPIGEVEMHPYRKLTTAQAIAKAGYENAVVKTDAKMMRDVRAGIISKFFQFLKTGTGSASGATIQAAIAQADAALDVAMETNGDKADRVIHFVNRLDIADYLAEHEVTTQTVFGMTYLQNYLGVQDVFATSFVDKGTVYVTPAENIHMYGIDFGALGDAGLSYTVYEGSLVGVHHEAAYNRVSCQTHVLTGATLLAEIKNYIVAARVGKALADMTVEELKALATARGVDITGKTTKDDILAALTAAGVK